MLKNRVDGWHQLVDEAASLSDLTAVAEDDPDLESEITRDSKKLAAQVDALEFQTLLSGEYAENGAILTVHAGAGGTESQDWAEMLFRMYIRWAEQKGFKVEVLDRSEGEEAGIKSATIEVEGLYAYGYLRAERGVHRLVRLSPYDAAHRRHTSFALVEVLPYIEQADGAVEI